MVLAGKGYYIYYGRNSTFKGGNRASDKHQAFNPMVDSIAFPDSMKYTIESITTINKLYPNIEYDQQLEEGTIRLRSNLRDPIPLATFFTYKGLPTAWSGTADVMTFNFSNLNDQDKNLWMQIHIHDQSGASNHLDIFLDGGEMVTYKWILEQGEPVYEEFEIKFVEITIATDTDSTGAYACDIDDGFDDGSFDQTGVAEVTAITIPAASAITTGQYFKIWLANGTGGWTGYYVWFNKDAGGGDPAPTGYTGVEVTVTTGDADTVVATAVGAALDAAHANFGTPVVNSNVVTVTQQQTGDIKDCVNVNVGTGFSVSVTTQGVTALDGGWSMWDGGYTSTKCVVTSDLTITFGGSSISGEDIQSGVLEFGAPKERYWDISSLTAKGTYLKPRPKYKATVEGIVTSGHSNFTEPSTLIASKTSGTFKCQYGTTKYLQFTNARIESISAGELKAGDPLKSSIEYMGGADSVLTYYWSANEATDPSNHIEHTNV